MSRIFASCNFILILILVSTNPVLAQMETLPAGEAPDSASVSTPVSPMLEEEIEEEEPEPIDAYHVELILVSLRDEGLPDLENEPLYFRRPDEPGINPGIYNADVGPLFEEVGHLQADPGYEVHAYSSWRQVAARTGASPRIRLDSLSTVFEGWVKIYDNNILLADMDIEYLPARKRALVAEPILLELNPDGDLITSVDEDSIVLQEDIDPMVDMPAYEPQGGEMITDLLPAAEETPEREARYRISDRRRVRFNEQHYFDHPKFGILLRVERAGITINETLGLLEDEPDEEDIVDLIGGGNPTDETIDASAPEFLPGRP